MDTITPSADTVFGHSDGMLKSMSTVVTKIIDSIDINSPPAHALALFNMEQANPRGYTRPMFFFETPHGVDHMSVVEIFRKAPLSQPYKPFLPLLARLCRLMMERHLLEESLSNTEGSAP